MKYIFKLGIFVFVTYLIFAGTGRDDYKFITSDNLIKIVTYFADEDLDGRLAGGEGYYKAAGYARTYFKDAGLKPAFGDSYYQEFKVEYNKIIDPLKLNLKTKDGFREYEIGKDFMCRGFTGAAELDAEIVYCGYGISAPELGYDDYKNVDVKGKVVLVFKRNPKWKIDNKKWPSGLPRHKAKVVADKGAVALIMVSTTREDNWDRMIGSVVSGKGVQDEDFPQIHVEHNVTDDLFAGSGKTLAELEELTDSLKKPHSLELKKEVYINVNANYIKDQPTVNVAAIYEGSDPELKDEYIILGAHLDHVGRQGKIYFPGANDNGSGSAAVMEVARTFGENKIKTDRSIIFALFSSEEAGLFGAEYMAANLPVPAEKVSAMMNMDCVGHGDSIRIGGGGSAPDLYKLATKNNEEYINYMINATWTGGGADATPFFNKDIPTLYFVTKNSYTHLHATTDTPETLNPELFEGIARLAYLTVYDASMKTYTKAKIVKRK